MLAQACEEVELEGLEPLLDPAVAIISHRIGFASPASTISSKMWDKLIDVCTKEKDNVQIELKPELRQ